MRTRLLLLAATAIALLSIMACFGGGSNDTPTITEGTPSVSDRSWAGADPAPEFPAGQAWFNVAEPLTLASLRGKVVVLDFWTQGCINCQHIVPDLKQLEAEFGDALVVIGVHSGKYDREHEDASVRDAILKYGLEHPVVNDPGYAIWRAYATNAWPTVVLIDPAGNLVGKHAGEGVYPLVQPIVASLLAEFEGRIDRTPIPIDLEASTLPASVLAFPSTVLPDPDRDRLYIADAGHNRIVVTRLDGWVLDVIGSGEPGFADGSFAEAAFREPQGLALSPDGATLYVADTRNHAVRAIDLAGGAVTTVAGTGEQLERFPREGAPARETALASPWGLSLVGSTLYIGMAGVHQLWALDLAASTIGVFAGTSREGIDDGPRLTMATLAQPSGMASDSDYLYWVDPESSSVRLVPLEGANGEVSTIVGTGLFDFGDEDGVGESVLLEHPQGLALHEGDLYVADTYNHKLKRVSPLTGETKTIAGDGSQGWADGLGDAVRFNEPGGLGVAGDTLYIADTNNHLIRTLDLTTGEVATLALSNVGAAAPSSAAHRVDLPAQSVAPGEANLRVTFRAPSGLKLNATGPSSLQLVSSNPSVATLSESTITWSTSDPLIELPIPLSLAPGATTITATAAIPYCRDGEEALCFIESVELVLPLTVEPSATIGDPILAYDLPAP